MKQKIIMTAMHNCFGFYKFNKTVVNKKFFTPCKIFNISLMLSQKGFGGVKDRQQANTYLKILTLHKLELNSNF